MVEFKYESAHMNPPGKHKKCYIIGLCFYWSLILAQGTAPTAFAQQTQDAKSRQHLLDQEAANALWRFKKTLEEEGFYSARVRLNIWRAAAIDAGKFDPAKYEEFKKQLYEKSVADSLKCFDYFIEQKSYFDANLCLQTYKMHAAEISTFDQTKYDELLKRLNSLKEKKPE
jgi:hypothetical protein